MHYRGKTSSRGAVSCTHCVVMSKRGSDTHHLKRIVVVETILNVCALNRRIMVRFAANDQQFLEEISSVLHDVFRAVTNDLPSQNPDHVPKTFRRPYFGVGKWDRHDSAEKKKSCILSVFAGSVQQCQEGVRSSIQSRVSFFFFFFLLSFFFFAFFFSFGWDGTVSVSSVCLQLCLVNAQWECLSHVLTSMKL